MLLIINHDSTKFRHVCTYPAVNQENSTFFAVTTKLYSKLFSYLYQALKSAIADTEREIRSQEIYKLGDSLTDKVLPLGNLSDFQVVGKNGRYYVSLRDFGNTCTCPDHAQRTDFSGHYGIECKHIKAVKTYCQTVKNVTPSMLQELVNYTYNKAVNNSCQALTTKPAKQLVKV